MLIRPPLIFDTDVISCFAWVRRMDILEHLFSGNMKVLNEVAAELGYRKTPHLKQALDDSVSNSHMEIISLNPLSPETIDFARLIGLGTIGTGEAAAMAYVKYNGGTVSSNNMRDVLNYCIDNNLALLGTSGIIFDAINKGVLSLSEANAVWANMIRKGRKIHFPTATDVYNHYTTGVGTTRGVQKY